MIQLILLAVVGFYSLFFSFAVKQNKKVVGHADVAFG